MCSGPVIWFLTLFKIILYIRFSTTLDFSRKVLSSLLVWPHIEEMQKQSAKSEFSMFKSTITGTKKREDFPKSSSWKYSHFGTITCHFNGITTKVTYLYLGSKNVIVTINVAI